MEQDPSEEPNCNDHQQQKDQTQKTQQEGDSGPNPLVARDKRRGLVASVVDPIVDLTNLNPQLIKGVNRVRCGQPVSRVLSVVETTALVGPIVLRLVPLDQEAETL